MKEPHKLVEEVNELLDDTIGELDRAEQVISFILKAVDEQVIGKDDTKGAVVQGLIIPMQFTEVYLRNELRASQRKLLKKLKEE